MGRCEQLGDVRPAEKTQLLQEKGSLGRGWVGAGASGGAVLAGCTSLHFQGLWEKASTHFILEAVAPACIPHHTGGGNRIRGVRPRPAEHVLLCLA